MAYLAGTKDWGLEYTPEGERAFYTRFDDLLRPAGKQDADFVAFSD